MALTSLSWPTRSSSRRRIRRRLRVLRTAPSSRRGRVEPPSGDRIEIADENKNPLEASMKKLSLVPFVFFALILCVAQAVAATTPPMGAVLTWHNDSFRTGWQQQETILTSVPGISGLGISQTVTLSDQVDAQPLIIPGFGINGHDIVFVADESNNV